MSQPWVKKKQLLLLRAYNQSQRILERLGRRKPGFVEAVFERVREE